MGTFQRATIPVIYLSPDGKYENNILGVEINDCYNDHKLWEFVGVMSNLLQKNLPFKLIKGDTATINMKLEKEHSFLEYRKGGMGTNNNWYRFHIIKFRPKLPNSLHNINQIQWMHMKKE